MSLLRVLDRLEAACKKCSRDPKSVRLVAVTKGHSVAEIQLRVLAYGNFSLGESRIQEALPKMQALTAEWHFIGPLQRNKARFATGFSLIHSVDSLKLAQTLARKALEEKKVLKILLEVNVAREPQKHGFMEEELADAVAKVREMEGLEALGLMTIAPIASDPEQVRPVFRRLSSLADRFQLIERSMGMSQDFEAAIQEGATLVRVGRAIFQEA